MYHWQKLISLVILLINHLFLSSSLQRFFNHLTDRESRQSISQVIELSDQGLLSELRWVHCLYSTQKLWVSIETVFASLNWRQRVLFTTTLMFFDCVIDILMLIWLFNFSHCELNMSVVIDVIHDWTFLFYLKSSAHSLSSASHRD